jgi:hypothetical protein
MGGDGGSVDGLVHGATGSQRPIPTLFCA